MKCPECYRENHDQASICLYCHAGIPQASAKATRFKPPLDGLRMTLQFLAGLLTGFAGIFAGFSVSDRLFPGSELGLIAVHFLSGYVGYVLACPLGVYLVGRFGELTGSFWATLFGAIVITALLYLAIFGNPLLRLMNPPDIFLPILVILFAAVPLIGAIVGFNLTRKERLRP